MTRTMKEIALEHLYEMRDLIEGGAQITECSLSQPLARSANGEGTGYSHRPIGRGIRITVRTSPLMRDEEVAS